ncbi:fimbrial protein [Vibrio breoganii]|uniref:Fimbrial protein n=1 Tax=Vibrio breoganii TaxID=553239 RepID=A0AAN0XTE4_9VIBR|nr:fimbrial protein [Vibrio breoganii]ANO32219.1 fimbrial protein [Vibrio breoganii]PMO33282.1 fimbrial protein [Vibrio breoganii]
MDIKSQIVGFFQDEEGLTVVEYVLGAALLVAAITAVFTSLEGGLINSLNNTMADLNSKNTSTN